MELPASVSTQFEALQNLSEDEVIERLSEDPFSLYTFFKAAVVDPIWRKKNEQFFDKFCQATTDLYLQGKISIDLAEKIKEALYRIHSENPVHFPKDLTLLIDQHSFKTNSLLFSLSSPYFNSLMTAQGVDASHKKLKIYGVNPEFLQTALEYVETGYLHELWKLDRLPILNLLKNASAFEMDGIIKLTSENYKRYLNRVNVIDSILLAIENRWLVLYELSLETLNSFDTGVLLQNQSFERLLIEFFDFREQALDIFYRLKAKITDVAVHGDLMDDSRFSEIMSELKGLISLDISGTKEYSHRLTDVPKGIEELNLSMCPWVSKDVIEEIASYFPKIKKLNLSSNRQLDYRALGNLRKFEELESLNLSRCHQLSDDDLKLALQSQPHLIELDLEDCSKLTDHTFNLIGKIESRLIRLNLSKTALTDIALIELGSKLPMLRELNLRRNFALSDSGVLDVLKRAANLRIIDLSNSRVSEGAIQKIRNTWPHLKVIMP